MKNAVQAARPALLMSAISERRHNIALHGAKTHPLAFDVTRESATCCLSSGVHPLWHPSGGTSSPPIGRVCDELGKLSRALMPPPCSPPLTVSQMHQRLPLPLVPRCMPKAVGPPSLPPPLLVFPSRSHTLVFNHLDEPLNSNPSCKTRSGPSAIE